MADSPNPFRPPEHGERTHDGTPWYVGAALRVLFAAAFTAVIFGIVLYRAGEAQQPGREAVAYVRGEQPGSVLLWDPRGGDPVVAAADLELVVGRMREVPGDRLFVAAFAATGALRTRIGPLGEPSTAASAIRFVVHDGVIVVSEPGQLRMHDLRPGEGPRTAATAGTAQRLCVAAPAQGEAPQLFVVDDRGAHIVDPHAGTLRDATLPGSCTGAAPTPTPPDIPEASALRLHVDGDDAVAIGLAASEAWLVAAGIDPATRAIEWQTAIPVDPVRGAEAMATREVLAGGRLIATYDVPEATRRLTALDARSGERLWDRPVREIVGTDPFAGLVASRQHVYVVRATSVEVYEAATGALVTTLGSDSYGR